MTTKSFPGNNPKIEMRAVSALRPYPMNARRHSKRQVRQIAESIRRFGFTNPVLVSDVRRRRTSRPRRTSLLGL